MTDFKKIFDYFTFILLSLLAPPTLAILITWNTLPGETLYPLKQKLEDIALLIASANFGTKADLHAKIVDRRFGETTELLELSSGIGLPELTTEMDAMKKDIVKKAAKTTKSKDAKVVKVKTEKMITQLKEYDQELQKEKQKLASQSDSGASSQVVVQEVSQTQEEIQVIVKELEIVKERVVTLEQKVPAQNVVNTQPLSNPSPSSHPSPSPSPSPISRPGGGLNYAEALLMEESESSPAASPSPIMIAPSSSPEIITPTSSPEASLIPEPEPNLESSISGVEGASSRRPSLYPLAWGVVACGLIWLLTSFLTKLSER